MHHVEGRPGARGLAALAALGLLVPTSSASAYDYEHALIIIADDLGTDKVTSYAGDVDNPDETRPQTDTIDLLAASGVRFTDAWATPACSPTRASLFLGEHPYRHGLGSALNETDTRQLPTAPMTLQQLAANAGIQTALFGKWHVGRTPESPTGPVDPFDHAEHAIVSGFGTFAGHLDGEPASYENWLHVRSEPDEAMASGYATSASTSTENLTRQTSADAVSWMQAQAALRNRRLTVVSFNLPHSTDDRESGEPSWRDAASSCGQRPASADRGNQRVAVECLDGAIRELLVRTPDLKRTLVVFLGDNGTPKQVAEGNFNDGRGKATVFESGVRVPFIITGGEALADALDGTDSGGGARRVRSEVEVSTPVSIEDVYATVVDLLGLDTGDCTVGADCAPDSVSLRPALEGEALSHGPLWTEMYRASELYGFVGQGAVRIGDMKLTVSTYNEPPCRAYAMYDLALDRWEQTDVFFDPAYADARIALVQELNAHAAGMTASGNDWLAFDLCCTDTEGWYDGLDSDCDGASDFDQDGDGEDAAAYGGTDCDDLDPAAFPGADDPEGDGADTNCDGADGIAPPPDTGDADTPEPPTGSCGGCATGGSPWMPLGAATLWGMVSTARRRRRREGA
jgi:arylsulfatase A-like enzyme